MYVWYVLINDIHTYIHNLFIPWPSWSLRYKELSSSDVDTAWGRGREWVDVDAGWVGDGWIGWRFRWRPTTTTSSGRAGLVEFPAAIVGHIRCQDEPWSEKVPCYSLGRRSDGRVTSRSAIFYFYSLQYLGRRLWFSVAPLVHSFIHSYSFIFSCQNTTKHELGDAIYYLQSIQSRAYLWRLMKCRM